MIFIYPSRCDPLHGAVEGFEEVDFARSGFFFVAEESTDGAVHSVLQHDGDFVFSFARRVEFADDRNHRGDGREREARFVVLPEYPDSVLLLVSGQRGDAKEGFENR